MIDFEYYCGSYQGVALEEGEFLKILPRAVDLIGSLCGGMEKVAEGNIEKVRQAVACEVEFIWVNGGVEFLQDCGEMGSVSLGNFRYSAGGKKGLGRLICPMARDYLRRSGLLYSGVGVVD